MPRMPRMTRMARWLAHCTNFIRLSLMHLKMILRHRGLCRRNVHSSIERVVDAVEQELKWSGSSIGYRQMHQRLSSDHGLVIDRETVTSILNIEL